MNIPLQVEEVDQQSAELPNYNEPVVLLLGTPDQVLNRADSELTKIGNNTKIKSQSISQITQLNLNIILYYCFLKKKEYWLVYEQ